MAAELPREGGEAPMISWLAVVIPVLGVVLLDIPIILGFMLAGIWALLFTGKLRGGYKEICRQFAKLFTDGATDVAPMVGFLMTLAMFNNSAAYASSYFSAIFGDFIPQNTFSIGNSICYIDTLWIFPWSVESSRFGISYFSSSFSSESNNACCLLFPLFATTTIAPQHLDITQSWIAWGLGYTKVSSREYMKKSIPTGWMIGVIVCMMTLIFLYGNF